MNKNPLNERLKLLANLLNTIAAVFFTIGVLSPGAAIYYGLTSLNTKQWEFLSGFAVCLLCSAGLHLCGRRILRNIA